ncbi:major facilitator superfamily domain-containing protein [Kickxella alabastrina]|uniref:major facilitator superfamily domain-containing protein n=1 Tax=Kickxella alabastrina TaxID=61397 RepID=UPI00221FA61E|nr:major facilitator superfamily domain-containing protein [Kickxella alabastrina]KAI7826438.1 major facilitator superfamily domain-containing protein [Kickxella alabastrina]
MSFEPSLQVPLQKQDIIGNYVGSSNDADKYAKQAAGNSTLAIYRQALSDYDNAKFGWFHVKTCLVAGVGFFTDSYDIFAINLCSLIMGYVYYADAEGRVNPVGCIIGQFAFGYLADRLGRKCMYGVELIIIIVCTIGGSFAGTTARGLSVYWILFIWRFILGIGIGGDYPVSAIITSEFATNKNRGAMIATVFAMQGFGIIAAAIVAIIVLAAFKGAIDSDQLMLDYVWRITMGLGAVPGLVALYFRLTIPETPRYTLDVEQDIARPHAISNPLVLPSLKKWKNFKVLMGTSVTWFALDVAFYGINLNSSIILQAIGFLALLKTTAGNIILTLLGTIPGYWAAVFTIDRLGRRTIQIIGFVALIILFCILGFAYHQILDRSIAGFVVLFTLAQFFQNFGPNTTTFIIPSETFPTRFRSTCHGISAACGKIGAVIAQLGFFQLKDRGGKNTFIPQLIKIFALFMLVGLLFTWFVPETKGKTLEELSNERDED